jgi:hypothetical protein
MLRVISNTCVLQGPLRQNLIQLPAVKIKVDATFIVNWLMGHLQALLRITGVQPRHVTRNIAD